MEKIDVFSLSCIMISKIIRAVNLDLKAHYKHTKKIKGQSVKINP
jgi:hypothetical protein